MQRQLYVKTTPPAWGGLSHPWGLLVASVPAQGAYGAVASRVTAFQSVGKSFRPPHAGTGVDNPSYPHETSFSGSRNGDRLACVEQCDTFVWKRSVGTADPPRPFFRSVRSVTLANAVATAFVQSCPLALARTAPLRRGTLKLVPK